MSGIWTTLGIERTRDRATVRRAYAALLKKTNPEDDPEGFKRLREVYDAALTYVDEGYEPYHFDGDVEAWDEDDDEPEGDAWATSDIAIRERPESASAPASVVVDHEDAGRRRVFDDACQRLVDLVRQGAAADPEQIRAAGAEVMASEVLIDVGTYNRIEAWVADLIVYNLPWADPLVEPAIGRFDWQARGRTLTVTDAIRTVLAREDDKRFLRQLGAPRHPDHAAFLALSQTGSGPSFWRKLRGPWLGGSVRGLLETIDYRHPTLHNDLDAAAVEWWRDYFSKPRIGPAAWIVVLGLPTLAALFGLFAGAPNFERRLVNAGTAFAWFTAPMFLMLAWHFAFARPRHYWRETWSWRAPDWMRIGWAGAGLAVMAAAAALPVHPASATVVALLSLGVLVWAFAVGDDDDQTVEMAARIGRMLWVSALLAVFWGVMMWERPALSAVQLSIPVLATAVAVARNPMGLFEAWRRLQRWERLTGIAVVAGLGGFAFWLGLSNPEDAMLSGAVAVLVAAVSLLQRTPAVLHGATALKVRYYLGLATVIGAGQGLRYLDLDLPLFVVGMTVLLIGALASLVFSFFAELAER